MKTKYLYIILLLLMPFLHYAVFSQDNGFLQGAVFEQNNGKKPLINANIYWAGTTTGTISDINGRFKLKKINSSNNNLVISYIGFSNDTVLIPDGQEFTEIILSSSNKLDEVVISERVDGSYLSKLTPINTTIINEKGLQKLACCNLGESFENSAAVDVHFADAVTGAKQIQMLGLAGVYTQILTENVPTFRGYSSSFGMNYIPGSWMESIQISKGPSSVINGYESITGQINIEYKKPSTEGPLHLNFYANSMERVEMNAVSAFQINDKLSTMLLLHTNQLKNKTDKNRDGFLDLPLNEQINVTNRWSYRIEGKYHSQLSVNLLNEDRNGGQLNYYNSDGAAQQDFYGINIKNKRLQMYWKNGITLPFIPNQSLGFITSFTRHDIESKFGNRNFNGLNSSFYANLIYQQALFNTSHNISVGLSLNFDEIDEALDLTKISRAETVKGVFSQYTYNYLEKTTLIAGLRYDYNSLYGGFLTPRIHLKHSFSEQTILRASFGKGVRTSNIIAENIGLLAESRNIVIQEELKPEEAWNYGMHLSNDFNLNTDFKVNLDYFRTSFDNQVVIDLETDRNFILVYNLSGQSFSNSYQVEVSSEILPRFDISAAFRYNDVQVDYNGELKEKPLVTKFKGILTLSYNTNFNIWQFDVTNQFVGKSRLPELSYLPADLQIGDESSNYYMLHIQITKRFRHFDVYFGGENVTDYTQKNPIIDPQNPFGSNFNSAIIWGPIIGRKLYVGLRYTIK